ncbi:MFS transporter [Spirillospora sp. NBC_01491]|uniref:MFS transporter n=1 Tax=Spirillospora sp. NBC_01491 TaxID=2976007 RepID=UPI002E338228|nr:MFS transporter [Spirillospora sp. NBC_01491]
MIILDTGIVTIALPAIRDELGFTPSGLPWAMDAYMLALGGLVLAGGRAADLAGRRTALAVGVAVFTLASVACALAPAPWALVAGRAVQGAGAALAAPAALAVITDLFPAGPDRARAMGLFGGIGGVAGPTGVLLGGALSASSWRLIFLINLPIGAVLLVALLRMVPARGPRATGGADVAGAFAVTAGLSLLVYGTTQGAAHGWSGSRPLAALGVAALLIAVFVLRQFTAHAPLLPRALFASPRILLISAVFVLLGAALYGTFVTNALHLQNDRGLRPLVAAAVMVPLDLALLAGSRTGGRLIGKLGPVNVLVGGLAVQAAGLAWLAAALAPDGGLAVSFLLPGVVACTGLGTAIVGAFVVFTGLADGDTAGAISGLTVTTNQIGGAIGIAVTSTIIASAGAGTAGGGTAEALWTTAGLALAGALIAFPLRLRRR